jgi:pilus assembly protein CpaB
VHVNEVIGVAGYVLPGTRVDVVATASPTDSRGDVTSKVVLTNVVVLASGTKIDTSGDRSEAQPVTVVTLLVTPEEAERLTLASTEGKIQLALRNPLDESAPVTPGVRRRASQRRPARSPPAPRTGPQRPSRNGRRRPPPPRRGSSAATSAPRSHQRRPRTSAAGAHARIAPLALRPLFVAVWWRRQRAKIRAQRPRRRRAAEAARRATSALVGRSPC